MASARLCAILKKGGFVLLFLWLGSSTALAQLQQLPPHLAQAQFESGVRAMLAGDTAQAVTIFAKLYQQTRAIRVKLEWARAAYLDKDYALSQRLFQEVLDNPIPEVVRFNVASYLTEIEKLQSYTDYGLHFTRDTNPFASPRKQQVFIYGIPFVYTPPRKKETLFGVRAYVAHSRSLFKAGQVVLLAEADDTEYEGKDNNKSSVSLALKAKLQPKANWGLRAGINHYFQRRDLLLRRPYVGYQYRKNQLGGWFNQFELDTRVGSNIYPDFPDANGYLRSLSVSTSKRISDSLQGGAVLYLDDTTARARSLAYATVGGSVFAKVFVPPVNSSLQFAYTQTRRRYKGVDEFFLINRKDKKNIFSVLTKSYGLKIFGLSPALELGLEKSISNISINTFTRAFVNVMLHKSY